MTSTERKRLIARIGYALPLCSTQELLQLANQVEVHTATTPPPHLVVDRRDALPSGPPAEHWESRGPANLIVAAPDQKDD